MIKKRNKLDKLTNVHKKATHPAHLLVRAESPASVIWRASKFSDLSDDSPDSFLKPASVTKVKDKFTLSRLVKPTTDTSTNYGYIN